MCHSPLHLFLHALPKCEHHIHLEGSLSPSLLFRLAKTNNVTLPSPDSDPAFASPTALEARYTHFSSLNDFLHYYFIGISVLLTVSDFEHLAYAYFTRAAADGVVHAEVFFDPQAHTARGIPYATVVQGFSRAQARAHADLGISSKLIICFLRHQSQAAAVVVFDEAQALGHFSDGTVAGIGLDSSEVGFPPEIFREVFGEAYANGIRRTAHAGEEAEVGYIRNALDLCKVQRIDHGIRLVDDQMLLERVAAEKILVTICPSSNVRLRCVREVRDLPVRQFLRHGVCFSINSDDPAYFGGYVLDNYCAVQDAFGLSIQEWKAIATAAIEGSWCDDDRKAELQAMLDDCVAKFDPQST
jgi:adenosine deaminase